MIKKLVAAYEKAKQELIDNLTQELQKEFSSIFNKYPNLESFGWHQYTPYFNDGDPCTFCACTDEDSIRINGELLCDLEEEAETWMTKATVDISDLLFQVPDEILEGTYGDHVVVNIPREGQAETGEYSHD